MPNTRIDHAHFLINIQAGNRDDLDTSTMRSGIVHAVEIARREGMLTTSDDETTELGMITVSNPSSPVEALLLMLEKVICATPEARRAAEQAVASLVRQYPAERITILTEDERRHLLAGMTATRRSWEASDGDWITDIIYNGYEGYWNGPDLHILESAFCDNPILEHLENDVSRLGVLRILARPDVLDIICSPERAQPVNDFDSYACHIAGAVGPMTGAGRTSRPEDVLEALQLQGLVLERLAARLDVDEAEDESEAPRG